MVKHKGQAHEYIMTEVRAKRLQNIGYDLKCAKCRKPIIVGSIVMHKRKKIYHIDCWNQLWIELPELDPEDEFFLEFGYYPTIPLSSTIPTTIPNNI
jgi:hypothetical protein